MPEIVQADIATIANNPYRRLRDYPYVQRKLDALEGSIAEIGLWPSVIARPLKDRLWKYELAFGHHRVEAARRAKLKTISLIVDNLSDRQMMQYMGRENQEDWNAIFLIQLESWEAAIKSGLVRPRRLGQALEPIDIATLLGWVDAKTRSGIQLNQTALACSAAYTLIEGGYHTRETYQDLTVNGARDVAERTVVRHEQLEKMGRGSKRPRTDIDAAKRYVAEGAAKTAGRIRAGTVKARDVRSDIDFNAGIEASRAKQSSPLFAVFANAVADNLRRTLQLDADAQKLAQIEPALSQITMLEDWEALGRLDLELFNLGKRTEGWRSRLKPSQEKVVQFKALEGGRSTA